MRVGWGLVVTASALVCWIGQAVSWLAPATAERLGLTEPETDVDPAFWADGRGEALWDTFTLWTMVAAGVLLIVGHGAWPYFGLVGGGMYLYFAGRGIAARRAMLGRGVRIGDRRDVRTAMTALWLWGAIAAATIVASAASLGDR